MTTVKEHVAAANVAADERSQWTLVTTMSVLVVIALLVAAVFAAAGMWSL